MKSRCSRGSVEYIYISCNVVEFRRYGVYSLGCLYSSVKYTGGRKKVYYCCNPDISNGSTTEGRAAAGAAVGYL